MKPELADQARNRWRALLPMFGIAPALLDGKQHGCPKCGGKDRFRFDDKEGRGTWICNNCGAGDGIHLVMMAKGLSFRDAATEIRAKIGEAPVGKPPRPKDTSFELRLRRDLYRQSAPIGDDMAAEYLASRGFAPPWPDALRFVPCARVNEHLSLPAMIAMVSGPDGAIVNIHRTFLQDGRKAKIETPRAMMPGTLPDGSAVRLSPMQPKMGAAEGIENAMAAMLKFGMPVWSTISAEMMMKFSPPEGVKEFHVFGDNDINFTGHAATYTLARKVSLNRKEIGIVIPHLPPAAGSDWNDYIERSAA